MNVLLICDGNTCRSVMAEAVGRDRYSQHGWRSRGLRVAPGTGPARHVPDVLGGAVRHVVDHVASHVTEQDVEWADAIYAMTSTHTNEILRRFGASSDRLDSLSDINDPFGGTADDYKRTLAHINSALTDRLGPPN